MPEVGAESRAPRAVLAAFWACAVFFTLWNLWGGSLRDWDEGLSAERAREMVATGNFISPQLQYEPDFNKPPMYYQLTALAFAVLGESEFSVRIWSALFALACALLCWRIAEREAADWRAGLIAGVLLVGSAHWVNQTRQGLLDSGMMLGTLGFMAFCTSPGGGRRDAVLAGVFGGFAALVKGPLWLVVAPGCAWWAWRSDGGRGLRRVGLACLVAFLLPVPWFGMQVITHGGEFLGRHAEYNYAERISRSIEGHDAGPMMYLRAWGGLAPVSAAGVIAALALAAAVREVRVRAVTPASIGAVVMMAALMVSSSRRELYLVWVLPLAAAGAAPVLAAALSLPRFVPWRGRVLAAACILAGVALAKGWQREIRGDRQLKAAAVAIRKSTPGATVIATWEHPVQVPMFYSHRVAYVLDAGSAPGLRSGLVESGRRAVLLVKAKGLAEARRVSAEAGLAVGAEIASAGDWRVCELRP